MKQFLHTKLGIVSIVGILAVILGIVAVVVMNLQTESYRDIRIFKVEGSATLKRAEQSIAAYKGMQLANQDTLSQAQDGFTQLVLDENKYVTLEPQTTIQLLASGKGPDSNTTIHLTEGAITNHLRAPLPTNSTFEVTTPVGVMAVIGTTYRVTVMKNPDGSHSATLEVFSGSVGVSLKNPDQTMSKAVTIEAGKAAEIYADQTVTEFVFVNRAIDYQKLPTLIIEQLVSWLEEGVLTMGDGALETLRERLLSSDAPALASSQASDLPASQAPEPVTSQTSEPPPQTSEPEPLAQPEVVAPSTPDPALLPEPDTTPPPEETASPPSSKPPLKLPSKANPQVPPDSDLDSDSDDTWPSSPNPSPPPEPTPTYYTVTFMTGSASLPGGNFARQQVAAGGTATKPLLSPSANFTWYAAGSNAEYAFHTPVNADLVLYNSP